MNKRLAVEKAMKTIQEAIDLLKEHWSATDIEVLPRELGMVCEGINLATWSIGRLDRVLVAMTPKVKKGGAA